uniref:DNA-directed RNA polymerase n=1 Tax=viral metagenome TaxID=1070528 RepID=A0A6C0KJ13_9ZZZZ
MDIESPWTVINSYFKNQYLARLVRHQVESYNDFVNNQIKRTIDMFNPVCIHSDHDLDPITKKYKLEMFITFDNFYLYRPQIHENNGATKIMFPQEARLRNFTYASTMIMDLNIKIVIRSGDELNNIQTYHTKIPKVHIGKLPIMLKSSICILKQYSHLTPEEVNECKFDAGGYFIINGSEKTVLAQERAAENKIYCFNMKKNNKYLWKAEIKSVPDFKCISPKQITMMIASKNNGFGNPIYIQLPRMKNPIPLFILFKALGILSDKTICSIILLDINDEKYKTMLQALKGTIIEVEKYGTQEEAFEYIVSQSMFTPINMDKESGRLKKKEFTNDVIHNDLFPHCKTKEQKIYFLGYMTNRLLQTSLKWKKTDNRDSYINKRQDTTGKLLNNLFRNYFNKLVKDMQKQIIREINTGSWKSKNDYLNIINYTNIYKVIKSTTIENGIKRALATGDFGVKSVNSNKVGVAQVLNRLTYISSLSHLRRINTPVDKSGKMIDPRQLHNSSWGFICPAETPEGASVGVVKNLSYMTHVTIASDSKPLYDYVEPYIERIVDYDTTKFHNKVKLMINGNWIGISNEPYKLYIDLKEKKFQGIINIYTSIVFDIPQMEIRICTDGGRLTRPVLKVKNNKLLITPEIIERLRNHALEWDDLFTNHHLDESVMEYIDVEEQNYLMISMKPEELENNNTRKIHQYTHSEIHPSTIFGILASCIPFPEHNQSPRVTYQCAMGKQAMGMYVTNFNARMDKTAYVLNGPMRPLVDTRLMNIINLNNIPSGKNVIVAIATYSGYNQEDSIIVNQGALDRGLFSAIIYNTEKDEDKKVHGNEEIRCKPDKKLSKGMKFANYDKLDTKGLIPENTLIEDKDMIIGKVIPIKENKNDPTKTIKYLDKSTCYRTKEETYIDKNYVNCNGDGYSFCKVRLRKMRKPVIGDKMSSRHGQKGTIGIILPEENMPFNANGVRPDIIINPHAIPSRMTIGQLKETLLGKVLLELGLFGDGTSFNELPIELISDELLNLGYEKYGNELLMNGMTGEQIETTIFMGPVFYQRLKHMVNDKQHSRSIGPMVILTRQPAEGRSRDGGLRFGEMERDATISHGAAAFTKERMYDASDKYQVYICNCCGLITSYNDALEIHHCKNCDNRTNFSLVKIPYACKLLFQELITMNVTPRILCE